jgi:hypothetical protein
VRDIGALLDWIESQDNLDSNRVVVYGGSYGVTTACCNFAFAIIFGRAKVAVLMLLLLRWLHVSSRLVSLS